MRLPSCLMRFEIAAILYVDDQVDGDGRFALKDLAPLLIVMWTHLRPGGERVRIDRSISVSAFREGEGDG